MPRKKKTVETAEVDAVKTNESENVEMKDEKTVETTKKEETVKVEEPKPKRKRKTKEPIDEETRDTRALLKGARSNHTILRGILERVDVAENGPSPESSIYGVIHYGNFKVMIPALFMDITVDETLQSNEKASILRKFMNTMLGANIEYVITYVSEKDHIALGNRVIANDMKKAHYFKNKYRKSGMPYADFAMENKIPVEADIIAVSGSQIRVSVMGAEGKIMAKEAAWRYSSNLSENFFPGDTTKIIIKEIKRNEEGKVTTVIGSIRETSENPQVANMADYSVGSTCLGKITGSISSGFFIAIGDSKTGVEAFCDLVHGGVVPSIGDTVSCQLVAINYDTGVARAKITRIIRKAVR